MLVPVDFHSSLQKLCHPNIISYIDTIYNYRKEKIYLVSHGCPQVLTHSSLNTAWGTFRNSWIPHQTAACRPARFPQCSYRSVPTRCVCGVSL